MKKLGIKIKSWEAKKNEAADMCKIEGLIAHNYIPNPIQLLNRWRLADPEYFHDKLIAEINGQMIGWINIGQFRKENSHIFFFDLFVNPANQHQGIGTRLYNKFISTFINIKI